MKLCLALCVLVAALDRQVFAGVLDVGGPNADAATLDAALAIANEGDVIRVFDGVYPGFTVSGKSVSIVPSASGVRPVIQGTIKIEWLAPGQAVELAGIQGESTHPSSALWIENCQGSVRVEDCLFAGLSYTYELYRVPTAKIEQCEDVVITNSSFVGSRGSFGFETGLDGDGGHGGDALALESSTVALYRCALTGGNGGEAYFCCFVGRRGGDGGDALLVGGSTQAFLSSCILQGGLWGEDDYIIYFQHGAAGLGLHALSNATGMLQVKHSVVPTVYNAGSLTIANLAGTQPRLSGPALIAETDTLPLVLHGEPGARAGLFFGSAYDHQVLLQDGPLLVNLPSGPDLVAWRYLGIVGANGVLNFELPLRDLPAFAHTTLHLVGITVLGAERHYTNGLNPVIVDSAW